MNSDNNLLIKLKEQQVILQELIDKEKIKIKQQKYDKKINEKQKEFWKKINDT